MSRLEVSRKQRRSLRAEASSSSAAMWSAAADHKWEDGDAAAVRLESAAVQLLVSRSGTTAVLGVGRSRKYLEDVELYRKIKSVVGPGS